MGTSESKIGKFPEDELHEGSIPSTPILTHKLTNKMLEETELDPRSPSTNIARTPIEFLQRLKANDSLEQKIAETTCNNVILGIDPRSPTTEFTRTPIVVPADETTYPTNKHLEKVRRCCISSNSEGKSIIPPRLLESSPISSKLNNTVNKRKSLAGLLETNLDFTETDLDSVIQSKTEIVNKRLSIVATENPDPRSPTTDFLRTPLQVIKKMEELDLNDGLIETETISDEEETVENITVVQNESTNVFEPDPPKIDVPANAKDQKNEVTISVNITADVKEFDNKLTNLIYEDDDGEIRVPKTISIKDGNRTPLGIRNVRSEPKKSVVTKLKVSDKPRKSDNGIIVSKIPVFREKRGKKFQVQCENTPPRNMQKRVNGKKTQWDGDKTLVI